MDMSLERGEKEGGKGSEREREREKGGQGGWGGREIHSYVDTEVLDRVSSRRQPIIADKHEGERDWPSQDQAAVARLDHDDE